MDKEAIDRELGEIAKRLYEIGQANGINYITTFYKDTYTKGGKTYQAHVLMGYQREHDGEYIEAPSYPADWWKDEEKAPACCEQVDG